MTCCFVWHCPVSPLLLNSILLERHDSERENQKMIAVLDIWDFRPSRVANKHPG